MSVLISINCDEILKKTVSLFTFLKGTIPAKCRMLSERCKKYNNVVLLEVQEQAGTNPKI